MDTSGRVGSGVEFGATVDAGCLAKLGFRLELQVKRVPLHARLCELTTSSDLCWPSSRRAGRCCRPSSVLCVQRCQKRRFRAGEFRAIPPGVLQMRSRWRRFVMKSKPSNMPRVQMRRSSLAAPFQDVKYISAPMRWFPYRHGSQYDAVVWTRFEMHTDSSGS